MDERIKQLVNQIKKNLMKTYGEKIKHVILYGSHVIPILDQYATNHLFAC